MKIATSRMVWVLLATWCGPGLAFPARAQLAPPFERPGDVRPELPPLEDREVPVRFVLPPAPDFDDPGRLAAGPRFLAREFRIQGNRVFTDRELAEIAAPYVGREISTRDLQEITGAKMRSSKARAASPASYLSQRIFSWGTGGKDRERRTCTFLPISFRQYLHRSSDEIPSPSASFFVDTPFIFRSHSISS